MMPATAGSLSCIFAGSSDFTEVLVHPCPFQWATDVWP